MTKHLSLFLMIITMYACGDAPVPKPKAMLRLDYPKPEYLSIDEPCPFNFEANRIATVSKNGDCQMEVKYEKLNATVHITYKEIRDNLTELLKDAQNLTVEHNVKADAIVEQPFINDEGRKFGMFYEVTGDAASQSQFYLTDSTRHFLTGALYFYAKPNYDSILPAAEYIKRDMRILMESMKWQ